MTGKRESKKRAVRKALYEAGIGLIERDGYDAVSVDQIVAAAGVAKGTFFNHFPGKADLLADWYADAIGGSLEETPWMAAAPLPDRLVALALRSVRAAAASPRMQQRALRCAPPAAPRSTRARLRRRPLCTCTSASALTG